MKNYNIMTPGEKLRDIRLKFNLNQEDITKGDITVNVIRSLENNEVDFTEHAANMLVNNINLVCKEKNIDFQVTTEYLLEKTTDQANRVADEYIEYIKKLNDSDIGKMEDKLTEIDVFFKNYNTEERKTKAYIEIATKFKANNLYKKATEYILKAYESSNDIKTTTNSLILLIQCNIYLAKYENSIKYSNILLELNDEDRVQYNTKYNLALCYKKIGEYDKSIEILDSIIKDYDYILSQSVKEYIDIFLLTGSCLTELNRFNEAIALYEKLLKLEENEKEELCIMSNLADVYIRIHDSVRLEEINNEMLRKINNNPTILENYESYIYLSLAKNIKNLNKDYDLVVSLLVRALNNFKIGKCPLYIEDVEEILSQMLDVFIINDESQIEVLKNEIFELVKRNLFPKISNVSLKIIKYYNFKDKKKEITDIIEYLVG